MRLGAASCASVVWVVFARAGVYLAAVRSALASGFFNFGFYRVFQRRLKRRFLFQVSGADISYRVETAHHHPPPPSTDPMRTGNFIIVATIVDV